jgi:predicted RNA methylase
MTNIGDLHPDIENARLHNERNIGQIVKSLEEVGAARSIVIDEDNNILAGNGLVDAAGIAGIENVKIIDADGNTIIAVRRSGLTPEQKKRLALFDNRTSELAEWDISQLKIEYDAGLLEGMFSDKELEIMKVKLEKELGGSDSGGGGGGEAQEKWHVEEGQLWGMGDHRVMCGDCTDADVPDMLFAGQIAGACVTDPPYGVTDEPWDRPFEQSDLDMIIAHTTGLIACFNAAKPEIVLRMLCLDPIPERISVWRYTQLSNGSGMFYSWQPVYWWNCKDVTGWDSVDWFQGDADKDGTHVNQKSIEHYAKIIGNTSAKMIFDPFAGTGTGLMACERLGRQWFGIEINPEHVAAILERYSKLNLGAPYLIG